MTQSEAVEWIKRGVTPLMIEENIRWAREGLLVAISRRGFRVETDVIIDLADRWGIGG